MTKRIQVFDDSGKQYEPTHPKRAKGLVKKGRARFVGGDTTASSPLPTMIFRRLIPWQNVISP